MQTVIPLSPGWSQRSLAAVVVLGDRASRIVGAGCAVVAARLTQRIERLPPWCWPLLVAIAAWPSGAWAARRLFDASDDPLGIVALAALLLMLWQARARFSAVGRVATPTPSPRRVPLLLGAALVIASNLPMHAMPDLVRALMASVAIVLALVAIADPDEPIAPYAGLAILSLPLLSSLQFYAGYPLRVVTAEASRWLLTAAGSTVERVGSALTVDGRLVLVDAPCSGVQMAWVGYFTACVTAWLCRVSNRASVARLPLVGATVMTGNIVRNTLLVAADANGVTMTDAMHAAVGLVAFAIVAGVIGSIFATGRAKPIDDGSVDSGARVGEAHGGTGRDGWPPLDLPPLDSPPPESPPPESPSPESPSPAKRFASSPRLPGPSLIAHRTLGLRVVALCALMVASLLPLAAPLPSAAPPRSAVEWPLVYDGAALRPLALSPVEMRFAAQFPGTIARFANGARTVVLRDVAEPTRRLHPAVDCYRGLGFAVSDERIERGVVEDASERAPLLWRCFTATRDGDGLKVCERIAGVDGTVYTDVSSWYWAASLGQSHGPWRAITVATPLGALS